MSLLSTYQTATRDDELRGRVTAALVLKAAQITEDEGYDTNSPRSATAREIISNPQGNPFITRFLWIVASTSGAPQARSLVADEGLDDDTIVRAVEGAWDVFWPVSGGER